MYPFAYAWMGVYVCVIASQPGEKRTIDYVTLTFYSLSFPAPAPLDRALEIRTSAVSCLFRRERKNEKKK